MGTACGQYTIGMCTVNLSEYPITLIRIIIREANKAAASDDLRDPALSTDSFYAYKRLDCFFFPSTSIHTAR